MKVKVCPSCGKHNDPFEDECTKCGIDLFNVDPTDEENEKTKADETKTTPSSVMVRICESCGHRNPLTVGVCENCQDDLTGIIPTPLETAQLQPEQTFHVTFAFLDSDFIYELQPGKTIVGRDETMSEYLKSKRYVSRKHAEIDFSDGKVTIRNLSQSNYTFVNDQLCIANCVELQDGDIVGLGGNDCTGHRQSEAAYFQVRICTCT